LIDIENESLLQKEIDTNPMGRAANIEEICHVIIHLTSQHAFKITGQIINVDGGKNLTTRGQAQWHGTPQDQKGLDYLYESQTNIS